MAVLKLSAIASAGGAPGAGDQAVGVTGGATDNLFSFTQVATTVLNTVGITVGSAKLVSGTSGRFLYDNAAVIGEAIIGSGLTFSAGTLTTASTLNSGSGAAGQVTFWNGTNVLAGDASFTFTIPGQATLALGTITTNLKALNITGTWNASGVTFDAPLFMNITPTASAANSALIDVQQAGVSNLMLFNRTASTATPVLVLGNSTNPTAAYVYNTVDTLNNPTNYERAIFDFGVSTTNVLTIGTQKGGTGSTRGLQFVSGNTDVMDFGVTRASTWVMPGVGLNVLGLTSAAGVDLANFTNGVVCGSAGAFMISVSGPNASIDIALSRVAPSVFAIGTSATSYNSSGWYQWGGELRTTAATNYTNATPTTIMSVALIAGRSYSFDGYIPVTAGGNAGGVQVVLNASGGLTATAIQADSVAFSNNVNVGQVSVSTITTLTNVVLGAATGYVEFHGTITVNVAGTLNFQTAQNTTNATTMTIGRGARVFLYDMA